MIVVIQCAGSKQGDAPSLQTADGRSVCFVADPGSAPDDGRLYARPDDVTESGETWRQRLVDYNAAAPNNPLGLYRAYELYNRPLYQALARHIGTDKLYILSAGWGLIAADFLTPDYDITFSSNAPRHKRRRKSDTYDDLCMLPEDIDEPVVFFGGKGYLPLFSRLTQHIAAPRVVFYRLAEEPKLPGVTLVRYETRTCRNWQYECAEAFIRGDLSVPV